MGKKINIELELIKEREKYLKHHKRSKEEIEFQRIWEKQTKHVCKSCWELKYCPYGPLVEQFPLPSPTRKEAIEHNEFLKKQLSIGAYAGWRKKIFENEVKEFNPHSYPKMHSKETIGRACIEFGHICPVFFVNEPVTETNEIRNISRSISRDVMLRVVRRDNYTCQKCGKHLLDREIEFDHKIPYSKGGRSNETNIQVTCFECNRSKGAKFE